MSYLQDKVLGQSWVGIIVWDYGDEFIHVHVENEVPTASLPNRRLFHLPVNITEEPLGALVWQIRLPENATITFFESRHQGGIDTTCWSSDKQEGRLARHRIVPITYEQISTIVGTYQSNGLTNIVIGQDPRTENPLIFYEQSNALIPLYPIGTDRFISERGERFRFDHSQTQPRLTITSHQEQPSVLERITPYKVERVEIPTTAGHVLGATLLFPDAPAPYPAVLFCHYADTHFRDYYRLFADFFLERGIATLIYDKRGWGESTGEPLFSSIFPLADDATAIYNFLQFHPAIQSDKIGFWGASNGGWVAPLAASRVTSPAFVIAVSCAGVTPAYQEQVRRVNIVRELGASPEAVTLLDQMWQLLMDFYVNGTWTEETATVLQQVYENEELQRLPKQEGYGPGLQAVPPIIPLEELKATHGGTWADGGFDPTPIYASLQCPLLFVWGDNDIVVPLEDSHTRIEQTLTEVQHPDFEIVHLPNTTHKLYRQPLATVGLQPHEVETQMHGIEFPENARARIADWAHSRLFLQ